MFTSQITIFLLVITIFSLFKINLAQLGAPLGFNGTERDALLALKDDFNNSFLEGNWTGLMCYLNEPPAWYGISCLDGRVIEISLENMALKGKMKSDSLFNLTELSVLSFKNNSISGEMMDFSKNTKLKRIELSINLFSGGISNSLTTLNSLESLQLQDNRFTGKIPEFNQSSLKEFNVSNNELSGEIPSTKVIQTFGFSSFVGNPELCGPPSSITCSYISDTKGDGSKSKGLFGSALIPILLAIGVVAFIVLLFLLMFYYKKSKRLKKEINKRKLNEEKMEAVPIEDSQVSIIEGDGKGRLTFMNESENFELNDLLKASAEGLGKGNFGNSYKAVLDSGSAFVVKRLTDLKPLSHSEFSKQLMAIADIEHPNLLPIVAYYYTKEEKLLVYEFAEHGNVFNLLHGGRDTKGRVPFTWTARLSVAQKVARAIEHLHLNSNNYPHLLVPHGNLKSSNVLLGKDNNVLVSDYGLTSLIALPIAAQRLVAFKSPEYQSHKRLSKKSDVWSYGCFLLELLTGRVSAHSVPHGERGVNLGVWVHRAVREEWTAEIFDLEVSMQRNANHAMLRLLEIAIRCCDKSPEKRPEMTEVLREVENIKVIQDSEDEEGSSLEKSLTDDSISGTSSNIVNL